jgi:Family of unknown function (DUF5677)
MPLKSSRRKDRVLKLLQSNLGKQPNLDEQILSVLMNYYKQTGKNPGTDEFPEHLLNEWATDSTDAILDAIKSQVYPVLRSERRYRTGFESSLRRIWGHALDLLETQIMISLEAGDSFNSKYRLEASASQDRVFEVLTRLHARGCQIGSEVLTLLKAGFADGAHARWRTLHELAVVAYFIKEKMDNELAERYLLHSAVESLREAKQYQKHYEALDEKPIEEDILKKMEDTINNLCERFGSNFRKRYGWAAKSLGKPDPSFADIENRAGFEHMRPWYKLASHNVHANPKGIMFRLGYGQWDLLLAGPSNEGLSAPGQSTALSLSQLTIALLNMRVSVENFLEILVLSKLTWEVRDAFLDAHQRLEELKLRTSSDSKVKTNHS